MLPKELLAMVVFVLALIYADMSYHQSSVICQGECKCQTENTKINCTGGIPKWIPKYIKEVLISNPTTTVLSPGVFCNVSWPRVFKLTISSFQDDLFLYDDVFTCLDKVESLKILSPHQEVHLRASSLSGLDSVSRLDLSDCSRIKPKHLEKALQATTILPKLTHLILKSVGRSFGSFYLSQNFINLLGARHIVELNLSSTALSSIGSEIDLTPVCDSLVTLNISAAVFSYDLKVKLFKPCYSLTTLDISNVRFPKSRPLPRILTFKNLDLSHGIEHLKYTKQLQTLSIIYASGLISSGHRISLINCTVTFSCTNVMTEFHASGYTLPTFDLEIHFSPNHLKHLDLSANAIETIGPAVFRNLIFLTKIDLANNRLSETTPFNETFSVLFRNNSGLEELNLANNKLTFLPWMTLNENTNIKYLYLSGNMFQKLTFDIAHFINLTYLDLRDNNIEYLDQHTRDSLDLINHRQCSSDHHLNKTLEVDIRGNPLSCRCSALKFVKWFVRSPIFSATAHMYHCQTQGGKVVMGESAIIEAQEDCERAIRLRNRLLMSTVIPVLGVATIVVVVIIAVRRRRKRLASQQYEEKLKLLRGSDNEFQFPVFLSYSSEDDEFVRQNVLKPIQNNLQAIANTRRELVCFADRHFRPGYSLFTEISRCLENCAVVIAVMSKKYCKSFYCKLEIEQARLIEKSVIMVFIEDIAEDEMTEVMREVFRNFARVKITLVGEQYQSQPDWPNVCQSIVQLM